MKPWPGRVASRWPINWPQSCSSSPPAPSHRRVTGLMPLLVRPLRVRGGVYFLSLNQALLPLLLLFPGRTAILCCCLLFFFIPPTHTWSQMARDPSTTTHGHLKRPKPSRQTERDGGESTRGKGDKRLWTGWRWSGGRRRLGVTLSGTWNACIFRSFRFKLLAVADFLSALLHASNPAFGKKKIGKEKIKLCSSTPTLQHPESCVMM